MKLTRLIALCVLIAAPGITTHSEFVTAQQPSERMLVVISDLHFGVGRESKTWHPMEDFRWAAEFRAFLDEVHRQGKGKTDLVVAGDAFELWQSLTKDCVDQNLDFGCTEAEALARLSRILTAHGEELRALGNFARANDNRVVFVPGNHDAALLFPGVAEAVVRATDGGSDRVRVDLRGYWLSLDGQILVEHGHQMGHEVNKFRTWPQPFLGASPPRLERSWGEQFVQGFYNQYEAKYPIIDNVSEESVGIRYAREVEGWAGMTKAFGRFTLFYLTKLSWAQHVSALGTDKKPEWDLARIRSQGTSFLAESFPSDDPLGRVARQPGAEPGVALNAFTDEEVSSICDARALINAYQLERKGQPTVSLCPAKDGTLGAAGQALLQRSRAEILSGYLAGRYRELRDASAVTRPFTVFVYAHTHLADAGFQPMAESHPDWNPTVLNTGAWQRTVTPEVLEKLHCRAGVSKSLIELPPEELPACYSAVLVHPYADRPNPHLRFWTQGGSKEWALNSTCQWSSPCR